MTIQEIEELIVEEFSMFEEWMDKYQLLIDLGTAQSPLDEQYKTPQYLIEGCQSRVWIHAEKREDTIHYEAESDALIVKGIIALLLRVVNDQKMVDILDYNFGFIETIGLKEHLSPTRSNGLVAMVKQIKLFALAFNQ